MYMFILMSSGWYARKYKDLRSASTDAQEHIGNGNIVAFHDDVADFAEQMNIAPSDIEVVEEE